MVEGGTAPGCAGRSIEVEERAGRDERARDGAGKGDAMKPIPRFPWGEIALGVVKVGIVILAALLAVEILGILIGG